jgi:hypothetical protein
MGNPFIPGVSREIGIRVAPRQGDGAQTKTKKMTKTRKRNHTHGEVPSVQKCEPQEKKWKKQKTPAPQGGEK